jgi:YjbR
VPAVDPLPRIRAICMALPEVTERLSHGAPTWFVRDRATFANFWISGHHQHDFPHLTIAAPPGTQAELIATDPDQFFRPPYVGHRGWIGIRTDRDMDWVLIAELCEDAYRVVAPARLIRLLDSAGS